MLVPRTAEEKEKTFRIEKIGLPIRDPAIPAKRGTNGGVRETNRVRVPWHLEYRQFPRTTVLIADDAIANRTDPLTKKKLEPPAPLKDY